MLSAPTDLVRRVLLFDQKELGDAEHELPTQDLVNKQTEALQRVREALPGASWVVEVEDGEESHFQVAIDRDGNYEICIGMPILNLKPSLIIDGSPGFALIRQPYIKLSLGFSRRSGGIL